MNKISYKEFDEATKLNADINPVLVQIDKLQYLSIENILKEPQKLLEYLNKFPALDKDDFLKNGKVISYAPGLQQLVPSNYLQELTQYFNNLLYPMIGKEFSIEWYTNIFYPDMETSETSRYPHVDTFDMAINIWLTENHKDDGTAFYKMKDKFFGEPIKYDFVEDTKLPWKPFDGNADYEKYMVVPSKYNNAVIYSGKFYHSAYYVPQTNKERKSLVGGLFIL
jgi:hypothetical protein